MELYWLAPLLCLLVSNSVVSIQCLTLLLFLKYWGLPKKRPVIKYCKKVLHALVTSLLCLSLSVHINREAIPYTHKEKWLSHVLNLYEICLDILYV